MNPSVGTLTIFGDNNDLALTAGAVGAGNNGITVNVVHDGTIDPTMPTAVINGATMTITIVSDARPKTSGDSQ